MNFLYKPDYATDCLNSQALFLIKRKRFIFLMRQIDYEKLVYISISRFFSNPKAT